MSFNDNTSFTSGTVQNPNMQQHQTFDNQNHHQQNSLQNGSSLVATDNTGEPVLKRNYELDQISKAVHAVDNDSFNRSSFALKRTQSMGLLDPYMDKPSTNLTGSMDDYPHLSIADASTQNRPSSNNTSINNNCSNTNSTPYSAVSDHQSLQTRTSSHVATVNEPVTTQTATTLTGTPDLTAVHDDSVLAYEPQYHVDYLSHDWKESDISNCWRNIVSRRRDVSNSARLENASWRTWTKAKYHLNTVSPESVNWLKDYDITWLYGPLYNQPMNIHYMDPRQDLLDTKKNDSLPKSGSASIDLKSKENIASHVSQADANATNTINNDFATSPNTLHDASPIRKPILKKRTVSDKLFARQNSSHHSPTLSSPNPQDPQKPKPELDNIDNGSKDYFSTDPTAQDASKFESQNLMYESGASTYLRHHNYRHRPHIGHSDEKIFRQINLQYRHVPNHLINSKNNSISAVQNPDSTFSLNSGIQTPLSAPASTRHGPVTLPGDEPEPSVSLLESSGGSPVLSPRPLERHIHFNDRVEQCIVVDSFDSGSDDESEIDSDSGSEDEDEYDEDGEENEPGLFLSVRSPSTTSLHRIDRFSAVNDIHKYTTIAPLPATTLRVSYDESEAEERRIMEATSVAYAMSHNTQPRTHIYAGYDYNSVYKDPKLPQYDQQSYTNQSIPYTAPVAETQKNVTFAPSTVETDYSSSIISPSSLLQNKSNSSTDLDRNKTSKTFSITGDAIDDDDSDDDGETILALPSHLSAQLAMGSNGTYIPTSVSTGALNSLNKQRPALINTSKSSQQISTPFRYSKPAMPVLKNNGGFQMGGSDNDTDDDDGSDSDENMTMYDSLSSSKTIPTRTFDSEDTFMEDVNSDSYTEPSSNTMPFEMKPTSSLSRSSSSSTNLAGGFGLGQQTSSSSILRSSSTLGRSSSTNLSGMLNSASRNKNGF